MKPFVLCALLALSAGASAGEPVRQVSFDAATNSITVSAIPGQARQLVIRVDTPGVSQPVYALRGEVRHTDVRGESYLQMDSYFAGRGTFFTKALASSGPLARLRGDSDWRSFALPFRADTGGVALTPDWIELHAVLPESGTVELRNVALYQFAPGEDPLQAAGQWLPTRAMILIGALGGTLIGVWGGIVGVLASRGKARGLVIGSATAILVLGVLSLVAGIFAVLLGQPYAVYYPLLLIGIIVVVVVGGLLRTLPKRYQAFEMQKMQSMDALRS